MQFIKKNHFFFEIAFIVLLSLIPLIWFSPQHMIFGSDSGYPLDYVQYFIQRTYTWTSAQSFGEDMSTFMGALPLHGIQFVLSILGIPYFDIQKVTLVFWFASIAFAMYFCVKYFFNKPEHWPIRLISVVLYSINFYIFLFWTIGSQTTLSAYVLLPLSFLIVFMFIDKKISPILAAVCFNLSYLVFNAGGIGGVPLLGPVAVTILSGIIYQSIFTFNKEFFVRVLSLLFFSFIIFLGLNAYFLFPFLSSFAQQFNTLVVKSGGIDGVIEWTNFISKYDSYANLFRLQGDNIWYTTEKTYATPYLNNPILILASFSFPILAYFVLFFKLEYRIKKLVYFLITISLVGIFLSAGSHDPLGFLYELMLRFIPGFAAFRSAFYKFMPLVLLPFSILIAMSIYMISQKIRMSYRFLIPIIFISSIFVYHYPFFNVGNFLTNNTFSTMIKIPNYVTKFVEEKPPPNDQYRTLVLPPFDDNYAIEAYKWSYFSGYPIFPGVSNKSFIENNAYLNTNEGILVNRLYKLLRNEEYDLFVEEASRLSIRYVLLTSDVHTEITPREDPKFYQSKLKTSYFKPVWSNGPWSIYEINRPTNSKFHAFSALTSFNGENLEVLPILPAGNNKFIEKTKQHPSSSLNSAIDSIKCSSCISVDNEDLVAEPPIILPNSIFYSIKLSRESKINPNPSTNQAIYDLLGRSQIRLSELRGLSQIPEINDENWFKSIGLLTSNWATISRIQDENTANDLYLFNKLENYSHFQITNLKEIYFYEPVGKSKKMGGLIREAIAMIEKVQIKNESNIQKTESGNMFTYNIDSLTLLQKSNLIVDHVSLMKNENGGVIYPNAIKFDNNEPLSIYAQNDTKDIVIPIPKINPIKKITLFFPEKENKFVFPREKVINSSFFKKESCITGDIKDFKWYKTYRVTSKIVGSPDNLHVYITNISAEKPDAEIFKPDRIIDIDKASIRYLHVDIQGRENTTAVQIYFCADPGRNPFGAYLDTRVEEVYTPIMYIKSDLRESNKIVPKISYKTVTPTEYRIKINNASTPYFLGFSERYSDFWELKDLSTGKVIEAKHFTLNGYANGWLITRKGTYELVLKFTQQSIFNTGFKISIISILLVVFYLISKIRSKKNKNGKI